MSEIAALSKEMGYPVHMDGMENELLISYLLGISNVHPSQLQNCYISSDMVCDAVSNGQTLVFELAVAEPVRVKIQSRSSRRFAYTGRCRHDYYRRISLPDYPDLEYIGDTAHKQKIDISSIDLNNIELINKVYKEIYKNLFIGEPCSSTPHSITDPEGCLHTRTEGINQKTVSTNSKTIFFVKIYTRNQNPLICLFPIIQVFYGNIRQIKA